MKRKNVHKLPMSFKKYKSITNKNVHKLPMSFKKYKSITNKNSKRTCRKKRSLRVKSFNNAKIYAKYKVESKNTFMFKPWIVQKVDGHL